MVNFLAWLGNFRFNKRQQQRKVLIELFQKFAEYEAEPHFNAKASAFATVLRNREALLLGFGQSQSFPNVGKDCALSFFFIAFSSPLFYFLIDFKYLFVATPTQ